MGHEVQTPTRDRKGRLCTEVTQDQVSCPLVKEGNTDFNLLPFDFDFLNIQSKCVETIQ